MKNKYKILSVIMCVITLIPIFATGLTNQCTNAANITDLNSNIVFVKQQERYTCTLASNVMLLRRAALLSGDENWSKITESACKPKLWCGGMIWDYTYSGIHVVCEKVKGNATTVLKELLAKHPEGVVAYDYDYPHAILVTDYTNGKFYCADPARNVASGRIEASQALINPAGAEAYWYVKEPIKKSNIVNTSTISSKTGYVNKTLKINGSADKAEGKCKYTYMYKKSTAAKWTTIGKADTTSTTVNFKPSSKGTYTVRVKVTDIDGTSKNRNFTVKVSKYPPLKNESTVSKSKAQTEDTVNLKAKAKDGAGNYKYTYYYKLSSESSWTRIGKASTTSASAKFIPESEGSYDIRIFVKDKDLKNVKKDFKLDVTDAS